MAGSKVKRTMLSVGGACTSVAVELGELEGRYLALMEMWSERERRLQTIDWEAFKMSSDQVCSNCPYQFKITVLIVKMRCLYLSDWRLFSNYSPNFYLPIRN